MRLGLVVALSLVLSAGCKKDHEAAPTPAAAPGSAAPAAAAVPQQLIDDTLEYTIRMIPLLAAFDGDCAAQIQRMKALEPLVDQIRGEMEHAAADANAQIKAYMQAHKDEVVAKMNAQIAASKLTKEQLEQRDTDIKTKCGGDPAYQEEMNRIGVMKKKG